MTISEASQMWPGQLAEPEQTGIACPRIAIAGIGIESSTFSHRPATDDDFVVLRGPDLLTRYPYLAEGTPDRGAATWIPVMRATSIPSGAVLPETYERLSREIEEGLRGALPIDAVFLDIHGAMSVSGMHDAEGDLVRRIRRIVGPDVHVAASMDLHGNVSEEFSRQVDYLTCYRMAPHEDEDNTRARACRSILTTLRGAEGRDPARRRRWKAIVDVPLLLPGEKTSTRGEPAHSLYRRLPEIERLPGVEDASIFIGYAWADEPRCHAAVVVVGTGRDVCGRQAESLAREVWDARRSFRFDGPAESLALCLDVAQRRWPALTGPFVISDSGDNPTAGGVGDATWSLDQVLRHPVALDADALIVYAALFDAHAVARCRELGVGQTFDGAIGGLSDGRTASPLPVRAVIDHLAVDPIGGHSVVLRCGSVRIIVTSRRKPFHALADFVGMGLDPSAMDVLIIKMGYLVPEIHDLAAEWMLALTPGSVDQDLLRLGHRHLRRPIFPFDADMPTPDLGARYERSEA